MTVEQPSPPHLAPGAAALLDRPEDIRIRAVRRNAGWALREPGASLN